MSLRDDGISQGNTTEDIFLIPTQNAQLTLDSCLHDLFLDICGDDAATNGDRGLRAQFSALRMKQISQKSGHKNQTTFHFKDHIFCSKECRNFKDESIKIV